MNPVDFLNNVMAHPELIGLDGEEGDIPGQDDLVFIRHEPREVDIVLPVAEVLAHPWDELEEVLTGRREPAILRHLSRIVGYYSQVHNWNRSKLAELRDRHKGSYGLPGSDRGFEMNLPSKKEKPVGA